jgi:nucleoside-diphosphate-sugar epimerase
LVRATYLRGADSRYRGIQSIRSVAVRLRIDNSEAKRDLGIEHRPFEEGLHDYLEWEMDQLGMERYAQV